MVKEIEEVGWLKKGEDEPRGNDNIATSI